MGKDREKYPPFQSIKSISEVLPEEYDLYLQIPGWKVWTLDVWNWNRHKEIAEIVFAKNRALYVFNEDNGVRVISGKRPEDDVPLLFASGSFVTISYPDYLLEPLSEEEFKDIIEQRKASNWKTDYITRDLLTSEELKRIFEGR